MDKNCHPLPEPGRDSPDQAGDSASRILYVCHDGQVYGSQQSLLLVLRCLNRYASRPYRCLVSIARPGPLSEKLRELDEPPVLLAHRRLAWFRHDPRSFPRRVGDILTLIIQTPFRLGHVINTIRRQKVNVVHTNSIVSLEGALAAWWTRTPHVWHIRELFAWDNPKLFPVLGRNLTRWLVDRLSDRVVCISQAVRDQFGPYAERDPDKYVVIHNAVELPSGTGDAVPFNLPPKPALRMGYAGRLSEGKRFHDLLETASTLEGDWDLVVAGSFVDAAYERKIRGLIEKHGLESRVHLLGYTENLPALYPQLDLLVVPSLNEPFGRVVIEAMAARVPCVGANSGGIPEIITQDHTDWGKTGWLYPPADTRALSVLLRHLMSHPEELGPVRENAGRMVRDRFTIEAQVRKLDACYQALLDRNP